MAIGTEVNPPVRGPSFISSTVKSVAIWKEPCDPLHWPAEKVMM